MGAMPWGEHEPPDYNKDARRLQQAGSEFLKTQID
jgi:hypothetical protein